MPEVSVIMASYQHARFIAEAIESVLEQTSPDLELIIIDDGSTDGSEKIIRKFANQDARVRYAVHTSNQGISRTMNDGLDLAAGTFIAFIGSDDVWVPEKLQKQLEILEHDTNLVVWSEGMIIDDEGVPTGDTFTQITESSERKKSGDLFFDLLRGNYILASSLMFKRDNLRGIHFDNQFKYLQDFQFNVDMAYLYEYLCIPEPLVRYRVHPRNTVQYDYEGHLKDYPKIGKYFLKKYKYKIPYQVRSTIYQYAGCSLKCTIEKRIFQLFNLISRNFLRKNNENTTMSRLQNTRQYK